MDNKVRFTQFSVGDCGRSKPQDPDFLSLRDDYFAKASLTPYEPEPGTQWLGDPGVAIMGFREAGNAIAVTDMYRADTRPGARLMMRLYRAMVAYCKAENKLLFFLTHEGSTALGPLAKRQNRIVGITYQHCF